MSVKNPCVPYLVSLHFNIAELQSRSQIIQRLTALTNYRFVAYLQQLECSKHLVKLVVCDFEKSGIPERYSYVDFIVTEQVGYLSAVDASYCLHIEKLT